MRSSNSSNESRPAMGIAISPSRTNRLAFNFSSTATRSGKYRANGCPAFDCSSTLSPSRNAMQRKPSHLGSYCHSSPVGISSTDSASIGGSGGFNSRRIQHRLQLESSALRQERLPQVADLGNPRRHIVDAKVLDLGAGFEFLPAQRRGNGGARLGPH